MLAPVAAELADYCMVMLGERAGWPLSHEVTVPDNMRLLPPRPGRPALHPPEHLWEDVRANDTAHHHVDTLEPLATALCQGINRLASDPERLRSRTNFPSMQVSL